MELSLSENKKFLVIDSCTELEYEQLKSSLTKKIEGWRFHPLVKRKVWDGNVSFVKRNKVPAGLWKELLDICKDYDLPISLNGITDIFDTEIKDAFETELHYAINKFCTLVENLKIIDKEKALHTLAPSKVKKKTSLS